MFKKLFFTSMLLSLGAVACGAEAPQQAGDEPQAEESSSAVTYSCTGTCQQNYYRALASCGGGAECTCEAQNGYQRCMAFCTGHTPIIKRCS